MDHLVSVPVSAMPPHRPSSVTWQGHLDALVPADSPMLFYGRGVPISLLVVGDRKLIQFSSETS